MQKNHGFTLIELIVVLGIIGILSSIAVINIFQPKHSTSISASIDTLIADIAQQQLKAMTGDTEGRGGNPDAYGVHFETATYTLFHRTNYNQSDTANAKIDFGDNIQTLSAPFLNSTITFATGSGEVVNFNTTGPYTLTIKNTITQEQKTVIFNKLGIITSVN